MSDIDLVNGLIKQDVKAQCHLYNKWYWYLYAIAFGILKNHMDTEDVLQESFLKIYKNINSFTPGKSLKAWMAVIVKHTALTHIILNRKYNNHEEFNGYEPLQIRAASFIDSMEAREVINKAMKALQRKSPNQYMYTRLYFIEGMNTKEISNDIGVPEGTCKSQVSRGRKTIQSIITDYDNIKFFNN